MKNEQALDVVINSLRDSKKKWKILSRSEVLYGMKKYLCNQFNWKMSQFKGMSAGQIELAYYTGYKKEYTFHSYGFRTRSTTT